MSFEVASTNVRLRGGPVARLLRDVITPASLVAVVAAALGAVLIFPHGGGPPPTWYLASLWVGTWVPIAARVLGSLWGGVRGGATLRIDEDALSIVGQGVVIPGAQIAEGLSDPDGALRLRLRDGRELTAALPPGIADEVLRNLGLSAGSRRVTYRWHRVFDALMGGLVGLAVPFATFFLAPLRPMMFLTCPVFFGLPWLYAEVLGRLFSERSISVSAEGMLAVGRTARRYYRWDEIEQVRVSGEALELVMKGGRIERVLCDPESPELRDQILRSIEEARAHAARDPRTGALAETLASAGASMQALRETAAKLLTAAQGLRQAEVTEEEVRAILEDPTATPEQRIAAAAALTARGDVEERARVRVAAAATAAPKMRVALEAAAEGALDEATLRAARREARR